MEANDPIISVSVMLNELISLKLRHSSTNFLMDMGTKESVSFRLYILVRSHNYGC